MHLFHKYLDMDLYTFGLNKLYQGDILSLRYTLAGIQGVRQCNQAHMSKQLDHWFLYIGCLVHKEKVGKDVLVLDDLV